MNILERIILVRELNAKRPRKAVAKIVACTRLQRLAVVHQSFYRIRSLRAGKLFFIGFLPFYDRNRKHVPHEIRVDIEHLDRPLLGLLSRSVRSVSLLPQKLAAS